MTLKDDSIHMTRMDAIQDIRCGRGIQKTIVGRFTTFRVIVRRSPVVGGSPQAIIDDPAMGRRSYYINLSIKQVLSFIKRHYPQKLGDVVNTELDPFPSHYKEVA